MEEIYIPIPHYPPFKLRSSLIDKDPVIWVHLLDAYIQLIQFLLDPKSPKLNIKSQQQLQVFIKIYLSETAEEQSRIFSLGAINPDITKNTSILKIYVFQLIKDYSFVKLNLTSECVWNFIRIYCEKNINTVRNLVEGTHKSKYNNNKKSGSISQIPVLHKYIKYLILNNKFRDEDISTLSILLGQHTTNTVTTFRMGDSNSTTKNINKKSNNSLQFAESFVKSSWIEMLEKNYVSGKPVYANTIKNVMIISILSLSTAKLAKLTMELGITSIDTLEICPLFSSIILSDTYNELVPNLDERLPFLKNVKFGNGQGDAIDDESDFEQNIEGISLLIDLFPQLTEQKAKIILKENNGDVEHVTNLLLENPDLIDSITIPYKKGKSTEPKVSVRQASKRSVYDEDNISKGDFSGTTIIYGKKQRESLAPSSQQLKNHTLNAALRLMYESDEDEPDDTYDDQEKTSGIADESNDKRNKKNKMTVLEDNNKESTNSDGVDENERYLFSIFKIKGNEVFEKTARKSSQRKELRKQMNWSDEQIEGWLRMLLKSPRRFKILEEDFFYGGGNPNRAPKILKNDRKEDTPEVQDEKKAKGINDKDIKRDPPKSKEQVRRNQARNEKNKSSRANHNRKAQHDKKASIGFGAL
ncbi:unnamed protein product [Candida verbasci]|uniref:CUE domain-containing protein n=1 Tax=Candida verbasci TaxID=1227364 RepID=A0A9W4TYB6_9ASCO|nr:unnamed protein product [Candida verbasci]